MEVDGQRRGLRWPGADAAGGDELVAPARVEHVLPGPLFADDRHRLP
jgi:hypothetical protein